LNPISLSRAQVRAIDRAAIEEYGLPAVVLMENAGRGAAHHVVGVACATRSTRVAIVCGAGNNGGDGYVVARHVANEGVDVEVYSAGDLDRLTPEARIMREIVERMRLPCVDVGGGTTLDRAAARLASAGVVVDALLGTGFEGIVRPPIARCIDAINSWRTEGADRRVVSLDVPSGLDCDRGEPANATVVADLTVTFVAPKRGFSSASAARYLGRVEVVPIGAPTALIERVRAQER
jgi:NAD(P)H-hydrate epimerase